MSTHQQTSTFHAVQQFVVYPDKRVQVELKNAVLHFTVTGNEFDGKWMSRGMGQHFGDKAGDWAKKLSPKNMLIFGAALSGICFLLFCFVIYMSATTTTPVRKKGVGMAVLGMGIMVGLIMMIAGFMSSGSSGEPYTLAIADITRAVLLPAQSEMARRGEPQVARLQLHLKEGKPWTFGLPTDDDLKAVKSVIPGLEETE